MWWERARDLSAVIDGMLSDPTFMPRIDRQRIGAAGFSLGGYTMIAIARGITSLAHYQEFCASAQADISCQSPPEFGDLRAKAKALADSDAAYRSALAGDSRSYRDARVRAMFAMAPALGPAFLPESLERIEIPVAIVAGAADTIAPVGSNARCDAAHMRQGELTIFPGNVGHYVFTVDCTSAGRATVPARWDRCPGCRPRRDSWRNRAARRGVLRPLPAVARQRSRRYGNPADSACRSLRPCERSTPDEGEKGPGIFAPLHPARCQVSELLGRRDSVANDRGAKILIAAFRCWVVGEGYDAIRRPIADVVGRRFNATELRILKEPAQATTHIRLGNPRSEP